MAYQKRRIWISFWLTNYEITSEVKSIVTVGFCNLYCTRLIVLFNIGQTSYEALQCIDLIYYNIRFLQALALFLISNLAPEFFVEVVLLAFDYFSERSVNCRVNSLSISSNILRASIPLSVILNIFSSFTNSISLC